jgi:hypothetical protein
MRSELQRLKADSSAFSPDAHHCPVARRRRYLRRWDPIMENKKQTRQSLSRHTISDGTLDRLLDETTPPSRKLQSMSETPHVGVRMVFSCRGPSLAVLLLYQLVKYTGSAAVPGGELVVSYDVGRCIATCAR